MQRPASLDLFSQPDPRIPSVSQLTERIKFILEDSFSLISVEGEVSQPKVSRNGHLYFTLKDDQAQLPCVIWSGTRRRSRINLEQGQQIIAFGDIQVYAPQGRYQLIVSNIKQAGVGALQAAFERLKQKLSEEGLFDVARKKDLPPYPTSIGVVTSETSAAWQDILINLQNRWPLAEVKLYDASTQGIQAASELSAGITYFSTHPVDVVIIGRGGGSIEDLWPFNEEAVARAIAACPVPVISGVGHETDFTISDFVADARANTPTQAAILATPDERDLRLSIDHTLDKIYDVIMYRVESADKYLQSSIKSYALKKISDRIRWKENEVKQLTRQMLHTIEKRATHKEAKLIHYSNLLERKNPKIPFERGFVRIFQNDTWIRKRVSFNDKSSFQIEWLDGRQYLNSNSND